MIERAVAASEYNRTVVDNIFTRVNAEAVLTETGGNLTTDGTEQNIYINDSPVGVFKPLVVLLDLDNMTTADGDIIEIRVYYRLYSGGGLQLLDYKSYTGDDGGLTNGKKLIPITLLPNRFGVQVTITRTAGVDKAYRWEVLYE
jgi:hypothetical protein